MNTILITTTIHVPTVLKLYRDHDADVRFIVIGDRKTPDAEVRRCLADLGNAEFVSADEQVGRNYSCSELIGWNTITRRNIGILEAAKLKPDVVVTIDDDNIPVDAGYFDDFRRLFDKDFSGLSVDQPNGWFNAAAFLSPPTFHRGHPYSKRENVEEEFTLHPVTGARIGIAAGLWAGDPDIDAMTRIVMRPQPRSWARVIDAGVVVSPNNYAPFNSQNTAFRGDLAVLMHIWAGVGRYDDIWAAYVAERIIRDLGYVVHFGKPFVWQQRNTQSLWRNLEDEMLGMRNTDAFIERLESIHFSSTDALDRLRQVYESAAGLPFISEATVAAGLAFCDDFERVR